MEPKIEPDVETSNKTTIKNKLNYECLKTIDCKQGAIRVVRFNVDGSYCLTGASDKTMKLWNPYRSTILKTYSGHGQEVLDVCGSCDNSQIVSCGADKSVILWDVTTGLTVRRYRGHAAPVTCVQFNEESSVAISGSQDNSVLCWDVKSRKMEPIQVLKDAKDTVTSILVTDHEIFTSSVDCRVRRYDIRTGELVSDFIGEPVTCVSLTRDGQGVVVSSSDSAIRLIDKETGELLGEYTGHTSGDYLMDSTMDSSDKHVLSGSTDGDIWCWDLVEGTVTDRLTHAQGAVVSTLSVHPSQQFLLSAAANTIKLWGNPPTEEGEGD